MKIEVPAFTRPLFVRLCRGDNLILSQNGPDEDSELYRLVEGDEENCRLYYEQLGYRLHHGDNFFFFEAEQENPQNVENKLERLIQLVRILEFFSTHVEGFGEGQVFALASLESRCNGDPKAERFLAQAASGGATNAERLQNLLQSMVRQGYFSEFDPGHQEYRVLSAINYLFDFADRIEIRESCAEEKERANAQT